MAPALTDCEISVRILRCSLICLQNTKLTLLTVRSSLASPDVMQAAVIDATEYYEDVEFPELYKEAKPKNFPKGRKFVYVPIKVSRSKWLAALQASREISVAGGRTTHVFHDLLHDSQRHRKNYNAIHRFLTKREKVEEEAKLRRNKDHNKQDHEEEVAALSAQLGEMKAFCQRLEAENEMLKRRLPEAGAGQP